MAVIGLNDISSASMSSIGQKTAAQVAKDAQTKAVKTTVLAATIVDAKPASLPPGEVVKTTNDKGKVEYYVGTASGGVSKPLTSVSSAVSTVNSQIDKVERIQTTALRTAQKIELAEIKQELKQAGVPAKEITSILSAEKAANTAESTQLKSLLAEPMLQYGTRDPATNAFTASATKPTTPLTSLLNYSGAEAPAIQNNITSANNAVAEFQLLKGITDPFLPSGNTTAGLNPYAIYQALDNGAIQTNKDANGNTISYTLSPEVAAAKGDQSGLMDATGMSKASSRALGQIIGTGTFVGDKANVVQENGKYFVNSTLKDENGLFADRYGTQNALVDTGQVDVNGNKIFTEVATDNSKRNKVTVASNYIQNPDGTFTYAGVEDVAYTHLEGFNPIKSLAIAGLSGGLGAFGAAASGLSGIAANTLGGTIAGAAGAGLSGNNILKGGLLGALGGFSLGELRAAAEAAGGYDNLLSQVGGGDFSSFTGTVGVQPPVDLTTTPEPVVSAAPSMPVTTPAAPVTPMSTSNTQLIPTTDLSNSALNVDGSLVGSNGGIYTNNLDAALAGPNIGNFANNQSLTTDFINAAYPNTPSVLGIEPGTLATRDLSNSAYNVDGSPYIGNESATGGLLDKVKELGTAAASGLGTKGLITLGAAGIGAIDNLLTPTPKAPVYTSPELNPALLGTSALLGTPGVTDWNQYYNNLFKRQGVGAGQYLGYDIMNKLGDIPPELMGLLGTSAQPTQTTTTA